MCIVVQVFIFLLNFCFLLKSTTAVSLEKRDIKEKKRIFLVLGFGHMNI